MLIDSHSHLHFPVYKGDLENVLARMKEKNVSTLTVGTSYQNSLEAVEFSKKYGIPCSIGFHPSHAKPPLDPLLRKEGTEKYLDPNEEVYDEVFDAEKLRELLQQHVILDSYLRFHGDESKQKNQKQKDLSSQSSIWDPETKNKKQKDLNSFGFLDSGSKPGMTRGRIVAIGECGLDYFRLPDDESLKKQFKQKQREAFEAQIQLAQEFNLPLIIHTRASKEDPNDAYTDTAEIVSSFEFQASSPGVMHCYLGNVEYAKRFLGLGFYLSFSGIVTFKKADTVRESARYCPPDCILSETDCPYLAPEPFRGKQNEPVYVEFVLKKLEEIKSKCLEDQIDANFRHLFFG